MKYCVLKDRIVLESSPDFNVKEILESGQIFRFGQTKDFWWCASADKYARIYERNGSIEIHTTDPLYFENFFDLKTDYSAIKKELSKDKFMKSVIDKCSGIRILKREKLDTIIEFIISANNNITRIRKIVEYLCSLVGTNMGDFYAFPTIKQLAEKDRAFYNSIGAGYRGNYLYNTIQALSNININDLDEMDNTKLRNYLISLSGIGPKVANCIMLFGFNRLDCFPVDTWIEKVYKDHFLGKLSSREKITAFFEEKFGKNSGIAQQYLFYAKRENILK